MNGRLLERVDGCVPVMQTGLYVGAAFRVDQVAPTRPSAQLCKRGFLDHLKRLDYPQTRHVQAYQLPESNA
jgi:hypothetical protein